MSFDLTSLNDMDRSRFTQALGDVFEHSPWIAEQAFNKRPFVDIDQLHEAMVNVVQHASNDKQLALLCAHPELAGQEAQKGELTNASTGEQSSAGLHALSNDEMARIAQLNTQYQQKFGFPFIIAVRNHTKQSIFEQWERRLMNDHDAELTACLEQVYSIARIRLEMLLQE